MRVQRKRRLYLVLALLAGVGGAVALGLAALNENLLYFYTPAQVVAGSVPAGHSIRIGGLVVAGSVQRAPDSLAVRFAVSDTVQQVAVRYSGILPDLFREGQGIVAIGKLAADGDFIATEVLAKHDEKYMPPEVADALKTAGAAARPTPP